MPNTLTVAQISDMTAAEATPLLDKLSNEQLTELRELEIGKGKDKHRTTLLASIDEKLGSAKVPAKAELPKPEKLATDQRLDRIEQALASGDPTTVAMVFAQ